MSAAEETLKASEVAKPNSVPILNRVLDFLSSVRVGVVLLCVMVVLAMIGMLIMQQNVVGFESYYAGLTPAEKVVFGYLGFFDIYHSWYFNALLLILSLNIVLASIDHFPSAWEYIARPKISATRDWLLGRNQHTVISVYAESEREAAEQIKSAFVANGLKSQVNEHSYTYYEEDPDGRKDFSKILSRSNLYVFGESGKWNRMGEYIVHVALLTLFLGHFVALQTGFDATVRMIPGETTSTIEKLDFDLDKKLEFNVQLPFTIDCTDIQQKLIDEKGGIDVTNTLDWRTHIKINDPQYGVTEADVSLNNPFTYRGYRFFQAQTIPMGSARTITLDLTPENGGAPAKVEIPRNGSTTLADGTTVKFDQFLPDFTLNAQGKPDTRSGDYNNPAAVLSVISPGGEATRVFAFAANISDKIPVGAPKAGYKWRLSSFEKAPLAHVLSIKYDPFNAAFIAWYFGGFGLIGALIFVFFISHKRAWAMIEKTSENTFEVTLAGEANRNHMGFEDKFKAIVTAVTSYERG
jgi:cytochrome c biogenesis protein